MPDMAKIVFIGGGNPPTSLLVDEQPDRVRDLLSREGHPQFLQLKKADTVRTDVSVDADRVAYIERH